MVRQLLLVALGAAWCHVPSARGEDPGPTRGSRLAAIQAEFETRQAAFDKARRAAKSATDVAAAEKLRPSAREYGKRLLGLAAEAPADDTSRGAVLWVAKHCGREAELHDAAVDLIRKHHLGSPGLKDAIPALVDSGRPRAVALVEELADKGADPETRGWACFFLADGRYYEGRITGEAKAVERIKALMGRIKKECPAARLGDKTLGDLADGMLYEVEHLVPGKVAPEVAGADVGGRKMKLTDYRGRVVLLVYWGSWCGPCMAEVPHLRDLTAAYAGRPFTVVGVNCGDTKEKAEKAIKDGRMTWPVLFDGEDGPIAGRWNVTSFPTVYLIDAKGVIQSKGGDDLDEVIKALVREAERK